MNKLALNQFSFQNVLKGVALSALAVSLTGCGKDMQFPIKVGENPESITKGFNGNYYVTVMNGNVDGDAELVEISKDGTVKVFAKGFNEPKGIAYVGGDLYFSDVTRVWKVDKDGNTSILADKADFPHEVLYLNDVSPDAEGKGIYVADMGATSSMRDENGNL